MHNLNKIVSKAINSLSIKPIVKVFLFFFTVSLAGTTVSLAQCPTPTITPSGTTDLCTGGSVTLTASAGASYLWNTGATTQAIVTGSAGDYYVTVDDGAGCIETSDTTTVTFFTQAPPRVRKIIGEPRACPGDQEVYVVVAKPRTVNYVWTVTGGLEINGSTTFSTPDTFVTIDYTPAYTGSGSISVYTENGCGISATKTLNISYGRPDDPSAISGPTSGVCGTTQTYSVDPIPGATFTWTPPTPGSTIVAGQGTNVVQIAFAGQLNTGNVKVYYDNVCGTSKTVSLQVKGDVEISSQPADVDACDSAQVNFSVVADGNPSFYQWRRNGVNLVDGGSISGATTATLTIDPVLSADAGTYDCVVGNNCGPDVTSDPATLTVSPAPGIPGAITGPAVACPGTTGQVFSISSVPNATSYQWVTYHGATIVSGQGDTSITVDFGPTTFSGYYIVVRAAATCGVSDSSKTWVRYSLSVPTFNTNPTTACPGQSGVTYSVNPVNGADTYNWTVPNNATIVSGAGTETITVDFGVGFTGGDICVSASNICVTTADRCVTVNTVPGDAQNISGQITSVCNSTQIYSTPSVSGATGYNWTVPSGASITSGQGTTSITVDYTGSFTSGNICVEATNACGAGAPKCKPVVGFPGKTSGISGNAAPCANSTGEVYSCNSISGATSYVWTVPLGATIVSGQGTNTITVDWGSNDGNIAVYGVNSCGNGYDRKFPVAFGCRLAASSKYSDTPVQAFPNPFTDNLDLRLNIGSDDQFTINIIDQYGRICAAKQVEFNSENGIHTIPTSHLASGIYFVQVINGKTSYSLQVVKQ